MPDPRPRTASRSVSGVDPARPAPPVRVTVRLPAALRSLADGRRAVLVDAVAAQPGVVSIGDVLAALQTPYPGVHHAVLDERGAVRRHVNVFVGAENIRFGAGLATPVPAGDEVWILPAVSGG